MTLIDRVRSAYRAFVIGAGAVGRTEQFFGTDPAVWSPQAYGEYIATSNAVYSCATLRADLLASLPFKLYKGAGDNRTEVTRGALYELMQKVNPFWTFARLIRMSELSLCLWGKCYWFLERGPSGKGPVREIWWGRPDRVSVFPDPKEYIKGFAYKPKDGGAPLPYLPSEVIWFRYDNPLDEFDGLSPIAAARIAADYASAAWKSNRNLFAQGLQAGGFVVPKTGTTLTDDQAIEIEKILDKRLAGVDKAHRWSVFRFEAEMKQAGWNPKEAEFLGGLRASTEEIARAFKVPQDLIGGQRTYENVDAAYKAIWTHCILPEGRFIGSEMVEQLLPLFKGEADSAEFDSSGLTVLQEAETQRWARASDQIAKGAMRINEWRTAEGQAPVPWGDVWWTMAGVMPVNDATPPVIGYQPTGNQQSAISGQPAARAVEVLEFGGAEHTRLWERDMARLNKSQKEMRAMTRELLTRQKASVLAGLAQGRAARADDPFDLKEWVRKFREAMRAQLAQTLPGIGNAALDDLNLDLAFDVTTPQVARFIERMAQRFATQVNDETWRALRAELAASLQEGEGLVKLQERITTLFDTWIGTDPAIEGKTERAEMIARTEALAAASGGRQEAWKQSNVVTGKRWISALQPGRSRPDHMAYHNTVVSLNDNFSINGCAGAGPGLLGCPGESINCLCTSVAVVSEGQGA